MFETIQGRFWEVSSRKMKGNEMKKNWKTIQENRQEII